jgi:hypothetical protein
MKGSEVYLATAFALKIDREDAYLKAPASVVRLHGPSEGSP